MHFRSPRGWSSQCQTYCAIVYIFLLFGAFLPTCLACYVFPPGKTNPCAKRTCRYGAYCVSSMDGLTGRCQCASSCDNYGDSLGSKPVCGSDGKDYANFCELKRAACALFKIIKIKHYGKCGKYHTP